MKNTKPHPRPPAPPRVAAGGEGLALLEGPEAAARLYALAGAEEEGAGLLLRGADLTGEDLDGLTLSCCILENCRLTGAGLRRAAFTDCLFRRCDLSGAQWYDGSLLRCCWEGVKALGCNLAGARLRDFACTDGRLDGLRLDGAGLEYARLEATSLAGANLSGLRWNALVLDDADLSGACVTGASLRGLDLRRCRISGLTAGDGLRELRGAIVDPIQAAELARLLGLDIR